MKRSESTNHLRRCSPPPSDVDEVQAQPWFCWPICLTDSPPSAITAPVRLVVATDKVDLFRSVLDDDVDLVPLVHEPESRRLQLSQALLEAIGRRTAPERRQSRGSLSRFRLHDIDTCSVISLGEHLARLTSRDLQRLETQGAARDVAGPSSIWPSKRA